MQIQDELSSHFRLAESQKRALGKLNITTVYDLLYHFPNRYENIADIKLIKELKKDDSAIIYGTISGLKIRKAFKSRTPIAEGYVEDLSGKIKVMWFNQPYIAKMFRDFTPVKVAGKVGGSDKNPYFANPEMTAINTLPTEEGLLRRDPQDSQTLLPVYPESRGITSKWMYYAIQKIFNSGNLDELYDPIPKEILKRYYLPTLKTALIWIHTPKKEKDSISARKRFAFEEVFYIQLVKQKDRFTNKHEQALRVSVDTASLKTFTGRFPFKLTGAQEKAISAIISDFKKTYPMSRLLEGDVGSGKTAVAAATVYVTATTYPQGQDFGNLQTAYMVPTEILAKQHFQSFISYFEYLPIKIGLITSSGCKKFPSKVDGSKATDISKAQLLKWVGNGEIPILIGTHALIQKKVSFKNLAYVIIDEQHRFGTLQRQKLVRKDNIVPHLLSMTATPIPRTLALTIYGDLDLTLLDEMPKGRKPIITEIVTQGNRDQTYEKVREKLKEGRQVYVICPRIDEPDPKKELALNVKSVKEETKRLSSDVFPDYRVAMLHGKMKPKEKEETMEAFIQNNIHVLVATSVVEVGVNVPNATVIILEGAERFGLAQLHQLRGRVLRSTHQAYCYAFADTKSKASIERLKALKSAKDGFELAEFDLKIRGAGELYGKKQWGLTDLGMEAIRNVKMVEAARKEAQTMIDDDPNLTKHTLLSKFASEKAKSWHFE
ncbi:ATP-dependent DNA helicase RecG [Patescibacteria group bacterium]|nr:ATP-dependent DNA helicase RecG [Patescibacteria group bacterium]